MLTFFAHCFVNKIFFAEAIGKPQLENLCFDRAMDTLYQYTYGSEKSRKIRQIIGIFHQFYTLCIIQSLYTQHRVIFLTLIQFKDQVCIVHYTVSQSSTIFSVVAASLWHDYYLIKIDSIIDLDFQKGFYLAGTCGNFVIVCKSINIPIYI